MDHAIRSLDVGDNHLHGFVQVHFTVFDRDRQLLTFQSGVSLLAVQGQDISRHHLARNHMVQQDVLELFEILGLEQRLNGTGG